MLGKKAQCNGRSLDLNKPLDSQSITYSVFLSFLTLTYYILVDKFSPLL